MYPSIYWLLFLGIYHKYILNFIEILHLYMNLWYYKFYISIFLNRTEYILVLAFSQKMHIKFSYYNCIFLFLCSNILRDTTHLFFYLILEGYGNLWFLDWQNNPHNMILSLLSIGWRKEVCYWFVCFFVFCFVLFCFFLFFGCVSFQGAGQYFPRPNS